METLDLGDDHILEHTMFCPDCGLPLYPKDEKMKFFLLFCRACGYEDQLDYNFTWETCKVFKNSILPSVKSQRGATCAPTAMVTAVESKVRFDHAVNGKSFHEELSVADLVKQYEDKMGPGFRWESLKGADQNLSRDEICCELLETNGVTTSKAYKANKQNETRYKARSIKRSNASFGYSCKMILNGNVLYTGIPITQEYNGLKGSDIYVADCSQVLKDDEGEKIHHAILLIGFGRKNKVNYFRFMASNGTSFGDNGFSNVRAKEITKFIRFELLKQVWPGAQEQRKIGHKHRIHILMRWRRQQLSGGGLAVLGLHELVV
ncbi:hypothetical protein ACP70R_050222 [Stipagrostis hirtigluma subsp. patula]